MGKTSWQSKQKYNDKAYDKIYLVVSKGMKDIIKARAEERGYNSINAYINNLIAVDLEKQTKGK